jgi:calcineurin-like phosphoesterase family protein
MNYYISDIHFGNEALLIPPDGNEARKGTRPFSSVEEMNEKIIENINDCCTAEDTLYIIGDIAQFYNAEESISHQKSTPTSQVGGEFSVTGF